jgi:hypothetical protein
VWAPDAHPPDDATPVTPDLEDAVVVAMLERTPDAPRRVTEVV